jgi:hypothetical protein
MQFAEALSREEALALARFIPDFEPRYAVESGMPVISLKRTIQAAGFKPLISWDRSRDASWMTAREVQRTVEVPRLALAPPHLQFVRYLARTDIIAFTDKNVWGGPGWEYSIPWKGSTRIPEEMNIFAKLPPLPIEARQAAADYPKALLLWEADWKVARAPLGDPAILVPLHGDLFAVAYTWDLTEVEKRALEKAGV